MPVSSNLTRVVPLQLSQAPGPRGRRSVGFLLVFALANAGGVIGYLPLLTLLLPVKIASIAGEARLGVLTATVIAGAAAASLSNIVFGWLSDLLLARGWSRRHGLTAGMIVTAISYAGIATATSSVGIVAAIIAFQIAVNALLAPLMAIMADEIPDAQKGVAGGLLALGVPLAAAVSTMVVGHASLGEAVRFAIVALAAAACIVPLLVAPSRPNVDPVQHASPGLPRRDLAFAWSARLLVQVAGNVLSLYLLYYFESLEPSDVHFDLSSRVAQVLTIGYLLPIPVAVLAGRLSDRIGRRKPVLMAAAACAALGLAGMGLAETFMVAALCFGLYATGSAVFLALNAAFAMQLLPDARHRGRDLGLFNLTNTLPALVGPSLTWLLATPRDFDTLMFTLAVLTLFAGRIILGVRQRA